MPPAFPFPRIQAPAKAEWVECPLCDGLGGRQDCTALNGSRGFYCKACICRACDGLGTLPHLTLPEPRAFGWCGCTDRELCHEHAPKEAK